MGQDKNQEENTPKKKGWLSKLESLVYETETPEAKTVNSAPVAENNTPNVTPSNFKYSDATAQNVVIPGVTGVFDEKFYNNFLQVIEANNIDGVDYFEFAKAKKLLDGPGFTEAMKFQAAFVSLKANSDLTKEKLLETADFYIGKLDKEAADFTAEMAHEVETEVNSRLAQAQAKQTDIAKKQEEIVKLQTEMATLQGEIGALNIEAQQIQQKIESTAKNFQISLDVLKNQINVDKQNIQQYIQ